ncbi:MAG: glucoamylase family protein [Anaerolineaceae bacterium]
MSEIPAVRFANEGSNQHNASFVQTLVSLYKEAYVLPARKLIKQKNQVKTDLKVFETWIIKAFERYRKLSESGGRIDLTAEWVLDNHYILQQAFRLIEENLPTDYLEQLPCLPDSSNYGFPRIFGLIRSILFHQNYLLNLDELQVTLIEFQQQVPLTMGELWSIPIVIRFGLIEKIAHVLVDDIKLDEKADLDLELPSLPTYPKLTDEEVSGHEEIAVELIGNLIRSLRTISETDWDEIFEAISVVEKTLREDPSGVYPRMDFRTRNMYRSEIEKLARKSDKSETWLVDKLIDLSSRKDQQAPVHIGEFLIGSRRLEFEQLTGYKPNLKTRLDRKIKSWNSQLYIGGTLFLALILIMITLLITHQNIVFERISFSQVLLMVIVALGLIPPSIYVANDLLNLLINSVTPPTMLPKMDFRKSIPEESRTLVVIPGMISKSSDIENLVHQLEVHFLSNPLPGLKFALLSDFPDADSQIRPEDEGLVNEAVQSIKDLDEKYHQADDGNGQRFFLFHRKRLWNPSQETWMGWERKRGKLHELGLFLRGSNDTSFLPVCADEATRNALGMVKYIITVDADTLLPPGSAARMVGTIAHPLNQAKVDPQSGKVTSGYTILQPRVEVNPRSANKTWFSRIFAGDSGLDLYSHAVSDVYQDLFGEGIYVGKGIYDLDSMLQTVDPHIPENMLLSHDLLEGILGRAGLISDITLVEDYPQNYYEKVARERRWIRGDWQLLPWLLHPDQFDVKISAINRWKIIHNLLRSLLSPSLIVTFLLGIAFVTDLAWLWTSILLLTFGVPLINALANSFRQNLRNMQRKAIWPSVWPVFLRWIFAIAFLPYEAYYSLDAILITLRRVFLTHRHLLTWTTAEHTSQLFRSRSYRNEAWLKLSLSALLVVVLVLAIQWDSLIRGETTILLQMPVVPVSVLWLLSSMLVSFINRPLPSPRSEEPFKDVAFLRSIAIRTWNYFERFVGPQDSWLPPDHYQESPNPVVAHHTSPSNIGLYLSSAIGAYDLGYFGPMGLAARFETTMETLTRMEKHRGHFLNWYNTQTLEPLNPRYVSTVDSGNLAISLIIVAQACKSVPEKRVFRREIWDGYVDNLVGLQQALGVIKREHPLTEIDSSVRAMEKMISQIKEIRNIPLRWYPTFIYIGTTFWPDFSTKLSDLITNLPSKIEAENITRLQEALQSIDKSYHAIENAINELVPWIPLIETIPALLQQEKFHTEIERLKELLTYNPRLFQIPEIVPRGFSLLDEILLILLGSNTPGDNLAPDVDEARNWLDKLRQVMQHSLDITIRLLAKYEQLEVQTEKLIDEMDFRFLYNSTRNVFHIGYNLDSGQLDNSFYDLLASEARIASIFAISRYQAPLTHWIHLGRPITRVDRDYALLSWSATMFEYLMPTLYFHPQVNTLLHQSAQTMVRYQRDYAKEKHVPWGISESGFYQFDSNMNYQYRAFGVPALGFKRGLADDLVIAPYASLMALQWAPSSVEHNIHELLERGAYGPYGFYEAVDFTPSRFRPGRKFEVIKEYMSHHQGMILMSVVNYLRNDIMVSRIMQDAQMRSVDILMQEQVPTGVLLMMPDEQETSGIQRDAGQAVQIEPWSEPIMPQQKHVHLLSNGSFTTLITNRGSGFSRWKDTDLTRWHADGVLEPCGSWVYIQDMEVDDEITGKRSWSAAHHPLPGNPADIQVNFFAHMATFRRTENGLTSTMEVTISAEDPIEVRRVHLINDSSRPRHLRLTSYGEVVLNEQAADTRHPAYNKLFIESEYVQELNLLVYKHRKMIDSKQPVFLGHMLVVNQPIGRNMPNTQVRFETDRRAFLGREHNQLNPYALQSKTYLTGSAGSTLDPIFSLGKEIYLKPHDSATLAYVTFTAPNRSALLRLAERYQSWAKIENTFHEANISKLTWLGKRNIGRTQLITNLDLLSLLVYPRSEKRASAEILSQNVLNQNGLWRFGISGDYPIILLEINAEEQMDILAEVVQAQDYLRSHGFKADLVVLNTQPSMYNSELNNLMLRRIRQIGSDQWLNQRSGIFIRSADQIQVKEKVLLRSVARIVLHGEAGSLAEQLPLKYDPVADLPQLFTTTPSRRFIRATNPWYSNPLGDLQFFNGFGGFSPDGKEYVMHLLPNKPTPAPWVNVIGYPDFGFMVTQSGSQTTWAINSGENRLSPWSNDPVSDPSGEVLYLRDEETGDVWTPTPLPAPGPNAHRVRHGAGYSVFESESHGLWQEMTMFADPTDPVKLVKLNLKNRLSENRRITATYYLEWVLGLTHEDTNPNLIPEYRPEHSMLTVRNPYHAELGNQIAFLMTDRTPHGLTTDRLEFLGTEGSIKYPAALHRIGLSNSVKVGSDSCAAMQVHIDLPADDECELYFVIGDAQDEDQLTYLAVKYRDPAEVNRSLNQTNEFWDNLLTRVQVNTPDPAANLMLNRWWLYQALSCRIWGRSGFYQSSGAYGFRDQLQDVLSLRTIEPSITREQILNAAQHQFEEGDVLHWWHPPTGRGVRTRISDNLLWLPYVSTFYVEATGDATIWDEKLPFLSAPPLKPDEKERYAQFGWTNETYTLFEHCRRALEKGATSGVHGLPLIGSGDWNDGFNQVGSQGKGESVWMGWFLIEVLNRFAVICEQRGLAEEAQTYRLKAIEYGKAIEQQSWDGDWYLRAYYDDGSPLGSHLSQECQIDAIAQSWSVLSGVGNPEHSRQAMKSVWDRLVDPANNLALLFTPPFDKSAKDPGYIKDYPPGVRENGGQYTHASTWTAWAYAAMGDGERAWHLFDMLNQIYQTDKEERAVHYRVEPYICAADVYSMEPMKRRGGWTWYTGSASWLYRLGVERLLGLHKKGDSLYVNPVIPARWDGFSMSYGFFDSKYKIEVRNPDHLQKGVREVRLDGELLENQAIPLTNDGKEHNVEVILGAGAK